MPTIVDRYKLQLHAYERVTVPNWGQVQRMEQLRHRIDSYERREGASAPVR